MKHLSKVALSASVMIVVAQAMASSAAAKEGTIEVPRIDDIGGVTGLEVFGRSEVLAATSKAFPDLVSGFTLEGETLLERYKVAQSSDFVQGGGISNPSHGPNVASCHNACHQDGGGYC